MTNTKYTRFAIFVISAAILGSTAMIVNPGRMAYAQDNATATVDTDGIIKILKAKHQRCLHWERTVIEIAFEIKRYGC